MGSPPQPLATGRGPSWTLTYLPGFLLEGRGRSIRARSATPLRIPQPTAPKHLPNRKGTKPDRSLDLTRNGGAHSLRLGRPTYARSSTPRGYAPSAPDAATAMCAESVPAATRLALARQRPDTPARLWTHQSLISDRSIDRLT